ncbi:hypothetical protein ACH5RR_018852 [Cinchona calisaya]|uniref:Uncharacterized protein n=1 Tax=Cinchona calisaya TaxID=153742 RepID=A0ABD2ZNW7_9GENT
MLLVNEESYDPREPNMHDIDYDDEGEETLSFCEFSVNTTWDDDHSSTRESQNSSSFKFSDDGDEYFEFFSGELMSSGGLTTLISYPPPPENIIFCGKLISYKQPIVSSESTKKKETTTTIKPKKHKKKIRGVFRWKWNLRITSRKINASKSKKGSSQIVRGGYKSLPAQQTSEQRCKKNDSSVHKTSFLTSIGRPKWYLFLFGITKFGTHMGLRDMKSRQSRRRSSSSFSSFRLETCDDITNNGNVCMRRSSSSRSSKRFWAVLRALSCIGDHCSTDIVKASTGGIPRV